MNFILYKLFPKLNSLTKRRKLMIWLLVMSFWGAILGAYFKINDNPNASYILSLAVVFQIVAIIGLVSKWSTHLTQSEVILKDQSQRSV